MAERDSPTDLGLALHYVPRSKRSLVADYFALDAALGDVVRTTREPMIRRIRLAWWRERLEEIDQGIIPAVPGLEAAARIVAAAPQNGATLASEFVDRWERMLDDFPWEGEVIGAISSRGFVLFGFASIVLGVSDATLLIAGRAGSLWALLDVARHIREERERDILIDVARDQLDEFRGGPVEPSVRPLTMLGVLARRDLERWPRIEPEATPGRAWAMIHHRLTGKL